MASTSLAIQSRDYKLLNELLQSPYEAQQLWRLSQAYPQPFTDVHFVRRRLRRLRDAGLVQIFQYATESAGRLNYYRLTQRGYLLACGPEKMLPPRGQFRAVAPALQRHVRSLAELLVKLRATSHSASIELPYLLGDNQVRLRTSDQEFVPDAAFGLRERGRAPRHFLVELDCGTEPIYSTKERDSLAKKLKLYYAHETACAGNYRVLFLFAEATPRVANFLRFAKELVPDPRRHIVLAAVLPSVLEHEDPLRWPIFLDHDRRLVSLLSCPHFDTALRQESLLSENWFAATSVLT